VSTEAQGGSAFESLQSDSIGVADLLASLGVAKLV
jgi:hypothetical protein